ncbi:MAG: hypothetical protein ACK559_12475, partial [bacterium]
LEQEAQVFRVKFFQVPIGLQHRVLADVGGAEDIAVAHPRAHVLAQALEGNLRRGAHDIRLDARVGRLEGAADLLRRLAGIVADIPGRAFIRLAGGVVQRTLMRQDFGGRGNRLRPGQGWQEQCAAREPHEATPARTSTAIDHRCLPFPCFTKDCAVTSGLSNLPGARSIRSGRTLRCPVSST